MRHELRPLPLPTAAAPDLGTVGVVVCTHDLSRLARLVAAVRSVEAQTRPPEELLVVVDGDEFLALHVQAALPGRRVECLGENRGVSVARTTGARQLDTDLVVFLDDDAVADPGWLAGLLLPLHEHDVLGVSGRSLPVFEGRRPAWLPDEFLWALGCSYRGMPTVATRVRNFYGGCAVVRRSVFLEVGGYDPAAGHHGDRPGGGEEADFCLRASAVTGGVFAFQPGAVIHHHVPRSRLTLRYLTRRCFSEGVAKARMARRLPPGALDAERSFARALPAAVGRALLHPSRAPQAVGLVTASAAVLLGLLVGRLRRS